MKLTNGLYYKIIGPEPLELVDPVTSETFINVRYFKIYTNSENDLATIRGIDKDGIEFYFILYLNEFQDAIEYCKLTPLDFTDKKEFIKINLIGANEFFKKEGLLL